jgi:hypothetical protein
VVRLLLSDERVDPSADTNYAIQVASENGHVEVVRLLLSDERVDPSDGKNGAIRCASKNGHIEVVKLLLSDYFFTSYVSDGVGAQSRSRCIPMYHVVIY